MVANMALSHLRFRHGDTKAGLDHASAAVQLGHQLVALEPNSANWMGRSADTLLNQAVLQLRAGKAADALAATNEGCDLVNRLIARDPSVVSWRDTGRNCLRLKAELAAVGGSSGEAQSLANQVLDAVRSDKVASINDRFALPQAYKLVGDVMWQTGDRAGAVEAWKAGLAAWPKGAPEKPAQMAARGEMLRGVGQRAEGARIASQLAGMGYRRSTSSRAKV